MTGALTVRLIGGPTAVVELGASYAARGLADRLHVLSPGETATV